MRPARRSGGGLSTFRVKAGKAWWTPCLCACLREGQRRLGLVVAVGVPLAGEAAAVAEALGQHFQRAANTQRRGSAGLFHGNKLTQNQACTPMASMGW